MGRGFIQYRRCAFMVPFLYTWPTHARNHCGLTRCALKAGRRESLETLWGYGKARDKSKPGGYRSRDNLSTMPANSLPGGHLWPASCKHPSTVTCARISSQRLLLPVPQRQSLPAIDAWPRARVTHIAKDAGAECASCCRRGTQEMEGAVAAVA